MRHLTPADYRRMPWRNGGGTTTELVVAPDGAAGSGARFHHRVSIADVASDGPFSRFDGYDRHIMLLDGAGMTLDCAGHGMIDLRTPFEPRVFSGDWDVRGTLVDGPVRDFNLIVDRARAAATLEVVVVERARTFACPPGAACIVHVIEGYLTEANEGDTLVGDSSFELVPRGRARVAVATVVPLPEPGARA